MGDLGFATADRYRLLSSCVADSAELTNGTYCPTLEPTAAPTSNTMEPSQAMEPSTSPTMEPSTSPTTSPTMEPTPQPVENEEEGNSAFAVCSTVAALSGIISTMAVLF